MTDEEIYTNNEYYKMILEKLTSTEIEGTHNDNYYLRRIATYYGCSDVNKCNGRLIKYIAEAIVGTTYNRFHYINFYLKEMAHELFGRSYGTQSDNFYLGEIFDYIDSYIFTLSSDKDIIQLGESATLTASLFSDDRPVSGETVTFEVRKEKDDSLVETLSGTTDSTGKCSVSYTSKGTGDIYINANCMSVSKTYSIKDVYYYDIPSTENISKYTIGSNSTMTYDSINESYLLTKTTNSDNSSLLFKNINFSDNIAAVSDFKLLSSTTNIQTGFIINNIYFRIIYAPSASVYRITITRAKTTDLQIQNCQVNLNKWYHLKLTIENKTATLTLEDKENNSSIATITYDLSSYLTSNNTIGYMIGHLPTSKVLVKNLIMK